ncbi:MAG: DUF5107 domain-containing protein, partial [Akkermansiaceae bacterium]|nr:DUF5107 domain-containing protein [Akkermansiaceae bacterium]
PDDTPVVALPGLAPEFARDIGRGCARRVLPYRLQDRYDRMVRPREFASVTLDNGLLKAVFLPEMGGRLISLFDHGAGRELLFHNPVLQPANLALRDAWFAGGIEWNIGRFGHAHHTCSPVFAATIPGIAGGQGLRMFDYERLSGLLWQLDCHLPPGSRFLLVFTRVVNPTAAVVPLYWWTNIAVPETPGLRVLAPADDCVFVSYSDPSGRLAYGQARLPGLPTIGGNDGTYPGNLGFTNEFFFQCQREETPWEAALDGAGTGLLEAATPPLGVRKVFSWGMHAGGRRWQEYLAADGCAYLEIQAGLAPTQQHTVPLAGHGAMAWTQAFGYLAADPVRVHDPDWAVARAAVTAAMPEQINPRELGRVHAAAAALADTAAVEMVHAGAGWGALERLRRARAGLPEWPPAFAFPATAMGAGQQPWRDLLERDTFPEPDPADPPGEWMVQDEWRRMLETYLLNPDRRSWFALLHLGVMRMEAGDPAGAEAAWAESMTARPSAWACRNLAVAAELRGDTDTSLERHAAAWTLAAAAGTPDVSFAVENLAALNRAGRHGQAWAFYQELAAGFRQADPVRLEAAKAAYELDDLAFVEAMLEREFATIREGARDLTDLWFGIQTKREATRRGVPADDALAAEVRRTMRPPARIDFRANE